MIGCALFLYFSEFFGCRYGFIFKCVNVCIHDGIFYVWFFEVVWPGGWVLLRCFPVHDGCCGLFVWLAFCMLVRRKQGERKTDLMVREDQCISQNNILPPASGKNHHLGNIIRC